MTTSKMTRNMLFISHANPEDNDFTRWLALQLAKDGHPIWCDLTELLGG
ncbi:MAG: toll/interleukin-1 receptor domain-containing protein, partial [Acidobacteria bacterium]